MPKKTNKPKEIISKLRGAEVRLSQGASVLEVIRVLQVSEATYDRWRKEYGGMRVEQASRLKEVERENARLRKAVADLTLDKSNRTRLLYQVPFTSKPHSPSRHHSSSHQFPGGSNRL